MGEEGFDIYGDLEEFEKDEQSKNAKAIEDELRKKYNEALKEIEKLQNENADLKNKIIIMNKNFSSLLLTAKAEVARKTNQITTLQKEKDDLCFRRKQHLSQGQPHANPKNPFRITIENQAYNVRREDNNLKDPEVRLVNSQEPGSSSSNSRIHSRDIAKDPDKYGKSKKEDFATNSRKRHIPRIIFDLEDTKSKENPDSATTIKKNSNLQKVTNANSNVVPKIFNRSIEIKNKLPSVTVTSEISQNKDTPKETVSCTIRADIGVVYKNPKPKDFKDKPNSENGSKSIDIQSNKDMVSSNSDHKILGQSVSINKGDANKPSQTDNKSGPPKETEDILKLQGFLNFEEEFTRKDTDMEDKTENLSSISCETITNNFQQQAAELYKSGLKEHENMSDKVNEDLQAFLCEEQKSTIAKENNEVNWFALSPKKHVKSRNNNNDNNEPELHSTLLSFTTGCSTDNNRNSIRNGEDGDIKVDEVKKRKIQTPKKITASTSRSSKLVGHKIDGFEPERTRQASATEASRELKNALFEAVWKPLDANNDHVNNKMKKETVRRRFSEGSTIVSKKEEFGVPAKSKSDIPQILNKSIDSVTNEGNEDKKIVQADNKSTIDDKQINVRQENIDNSKETGPCVDCISKQVVPVNTASVSQVQNIILINAETVDTSIHAIENVGSEVANPNYVTPDEAQLKDIVKDVDKCSLDGRVECKNGTQNESNDKDQFSRNNEESVKDQTLIEDGEIIEERSIIDTKETEISKTTEDYKNSFDAEKEQAGKEINKSSKEMNGIIQEEQEEELKLKKDRNYLETKKRIDTESQEEVDEKTSQTIINKIHDIRNEKERNKDESKEPKTSQSNIQELKKEDNRDGNISKTGKKEQLARYNTQTKNCSEKDESDKKYNRTENEKKCDDQYRETKYKSAENGICEENSCTNDNIKGQKEDEESSRESKTKFESIEENIRYEEKLKKSNTKSYSTKPEVSKTRSNGDKQRMYENKEDNTGRNTYTNSNDKYYRDRKQENSKADKNNTKVDRHEKDIRTEEKVKSVPKEETTNNRKNYHKSENHDRNNRKEPTERIRSTDYYDKESTKDQKSIKENNFRSKKEETKLENGMEKHYKKSSSSDSTKNNFSEKNKSSLKVKPISKQNEIEKLVSKKTHKREEEYIQKRNQQLKINEVHEYKNDNKTERIGLTEELGAEENIIATLSDKKRHCGTIVLRNQNQLKKSQTLLESYEVERELNNISCHRNSISEKKKSLDSNKNDIQKIDKKMKNENYNDLKLNQGQATEKSVLIGNADKRKNMDIDNELINNKDNEESSSISSSTSRKYKRRKCDTEKNSSTDIDNNVNTLISKKGDDTGNEKNKKLGSNVSNSSSIQVYPHRKRKLEDSSKYDFSSSKVQTNSAKLDTKIKSRSPRSSETRSTDDDTYVHKKSLENTDKNLNDIPLDIKNLVVLKNKQENMRSCQNFVNSPTNFNHEDEIFIVNTSKVIGNRDNHHILNTEINANKTIKDLESKVLLTEKLASKVNKDILKKSKKISNNIQFNSPHIRDSPPVKTIIKHTKLLHSPSLNITKTSTTTTFTNNGITCVETLHNIVAETANDDELFDRVFRSPTANSILDGEMTLQVTPDTSRYEEDMELCTPLKTMHQEERFKRIEKVFGDIFGKSPSVERSTSLRNVSEQRRIQEEEEVNQIENNSNLIQEQSQIMQTTARRLDDTKDSLLRNKSNISNESRSETSGSALNKPFGNGKVISMASTDYTIETVSNNVVNVFITRKKNKRRKKKIEG